MVVSWRLIYAFAGKALADPHATPWLGILTRGRLDNPAFRCWGFSEYACRMLGQGGLDWEWHGH